MLRPHRRNKPWDGILTDGSAACLAPIHTSELWMLRYLPKGTAYLTDVGMTGPQDSVIGSSVETVLERFLTALPNRLSVADGPCILNSVLVDVDEETGKASLIGRIDRTVN